MKEVLQWMRQQDMVDPGQVVVVGFSGGADSTCLLDVMNCYAEELGVKLLAVHVHHGIRGEEADRDEVFCREFCEKREIAYRSVKVDVPGFRETEGLSVEEAARILRYEALQEAGAAYAEEQKANGFVIAVAHHRDDQAETILFHLCRGTDLKGLCGMKPKQAGVIRPLLCVGKKEILGYCEAKRLAYCQDSTNEETAYTRNAIRKKVLPVLEDMVNDRSAEHIAKLGEQMLLAEDYLEQQTAEAFHQCVKDTNGMDGLLLQDLSAVHPYLAGRVVYRAIVQMLGGAKDVTAEAVERVMNLFDARVACGAAEDVREGLVARKENDGVYLFFPSETEDVTVLRGELKFTVLDSTKDFEIANEVYTKYFDYDKLNNDLQLRHRAEGDFLLVDAKGHRKSLNRYFIDEKIPQRLRDRIWVLADGNHVVWVIGKRISEGVKVTEQTSKILKVEYIQ